MRPKVKGRFEPFSDRELEAYLVGELDAEQATQIEQAANQQPELSQYLDERRAEQRAFFLLHPSLQRAPARTSFWAPLWRGWLLPSGLAAAAAAMLLLYIAMPLTPGDDGLSGDPSQGAVRSKGAPKIELTVQRSDRTFTYRQGMLLRQGDRVRVTVESATPGWLCLLGRDGRGQVSVYYEKTQIKAGTYTLPDSLELDAAEGVEQWYAVLSEAPISAPALAEKLRRGEALEGRVTVIEIVKEATP